MVLNYLSFQFPGINGVRAAFQTRKGCAVPGAACEGNISLEVGADEAASIANRKALAQDFGLEGFAELRQVHGVRTVFAPRLQAPNQPPSEEADGLATSRGAGRERLALLIKTADCQPILLAHKSGDYILALHCGWKGNRKYFPQIAVDEFCTHYRLDPADLSAVRGPSLGPAAAEFTRFAEEWGDEFLPWYDAASKSMDLWSLARDQLLEAGLQRERIYSLDLCTWSLTQDFFSFRRDRHCGRQASFIWLE